jgi:hypothetical protein
VIPISVHERLYTVVFFIWQHLHGEFTVLNRMVAVSNLTAAAGARPPYESLSNTGAIDTRSSTARQGLRLKDNARRWPL